VYWFRLAATSGEKVAADDLANMYRDGTGVPADLGEAMRWYRLGAALGSSNAMTTLGNLYRDGKGVAADSRMAEYWYRLATAGGNRFAPFQHARMLLEDKGKAREEEALRLLLLSGDRGFAEAYARAADIYEGGRRRDLERAYYYALLASGSGLQDAPATAKRLRAKLPAETASRTERSAARWLEDNGEAARVAAYAK
jgi:TPR repeat protein